MKTISVLCLSLEAPWTRMPRTPRTRTFLREVVEVADAASSSDLYHWCAMVWGSIGSSAWA
jgi:hypothetical protein